MTNQRHEHWRVSVETSGEHIVSIEPEMLAGREISEADEDAIRTAAHHLLAFIGDPSPETNARGPADQIISQIEDLFPNWRSYRDLVDCITCELHDMRKRAEGSL